MTPDDLCEMFEALTAGDVTPFVDRLADDVVLEFPGTVFGGRFEGRRRVTVFLKQNQRLFRRGLEFEVRWATVAEGRAVVQWVNSGETRAGSAYANRGVTLFTLDDGDRITRIEDYLDTERIAETWPR